MGEHSKGHGLSRAQEEILRLLEYAPRPRANATGFGCVGGFPSSLLVKRGLATYDGDGCVAITDAGRALLRGDPGDGRR